MVGQKVLPGTVLCPWCGHDAREAQMAEEKRVNNRVLSVKLVQQRKL